MSTTFFISPVSPKTWDEEIWVERRRTLDIKPEHLATQIKSRWPDAEVRVQPDDPYEVIQWHLPTCSSGNLQANRNTIAFKYSIPFEEFVLWYRSIIPEKHVLFLSDDSSGTELQLTSQTTDEEVREWCKNAFS